MQEIKKQVADPVIIRIENKSKTRSLKDVKIFSIENLYNTYEPIKFGYFLKNIFKKHAWQSLFKNRNFVLSSGVPNISYRQIVNWLSVEPIVVGMTRIVANNRIDAQSVFMITTYSVSGAFVGKPIISTIDSYQYQQNQTEIYSTFLLGGRTEIIVSNISPKSTYTMMFFPMLKDQRTK